MTVIAQHDFVEIDYTGRLKDGKVFDTTSEAVAKGHDLPGEGHAFAPVAICVGERQIIPGLDEQLPGKEVGKEYTVTLPPEKAFGKKDIKKLRMIPFSTFREHKMSPEPGLQVDVDGERGIVLSVSGGRVIVNFNHPLAGKEVEYRFIIRRKITQPEEQIQAYLHAILSIPASEIKVELADGTARVSLPARLPAEITGIFSKKILELLKAAEIKEVVFAS